jgi:hypothetical protein
VAPGAIALVGKDKSVLWFASLDAHLRDEIVEETIPHVCLAGAPRTRIGSWLMLTADASM